MLNIIGEFFHFNGHCFLHTAHSSRASAIDQRYSLCSTLSIYVCSCVHRGMHVLVRNGRVPVSRCPGEGLIRHTPACVVADAPGDDDVRGDTPMDTEGDPAFDGSDTPAATGETDATTAGTGWYDIVSDVPAGMFEQHASSCYRSALVLMCVPIALMLNRPLQCLIPALTRT